MRSTIAASSAICTAGRNGAMRIAVPKHTREVRAASRRAERQRLRKVAVVEEMVLGSPDRVGTEVLGFGNQFQGACVRMRPRAAPRQRVAQIEGKSYPHELSPLIVPRTITA
jgi:hypothetical protein